MTPYPVTETRDGVVRHGVGSGWPHVAGTCPACGWRGLFVGSGGYVTCSQIDCPDPSAPSDVLHARQAERTPTPEETTVSDTQPIDAEVQWSVRWDNGTISKPRSGPWAEGFVREAAEGAREYHPLGTRAVVVSRLVASDGRPLSEWAAAE